MFHKPFLIDLHNLPNGGKDLHGTLIPAFFDLDPKDTIQATGPLTYDLHVERDGKDIVVTGSLCADFELECGRCLTRFPYRVDMPDYLGDIEIEAETETINLTELVREDILTALPSYPRCEDGNVSLRECPAEGRFEAPAETAPDEQADAPRVGVWDALDKLKQ